MKNTAEMIVADSETDANLFYATQFVVPDPVYFFKIRGKKYLMLNFLGQIVWTAVLMGIGYYLGNYYLRVNNIFGFVSSAAIIVLVFLALIGFGRYLKKRTMSEMS